jgi:NAD(P)-dependent dehydrogenase (short-subunit alcohol dehydrogenase family)
LGARAIVVADRERAAEDVAREVGGLPVIADVSLESDVARIASSAVGAFGRIDLFCSNAGISVGGSIETTTDEEWQRIWQVNLMAHVYAARQGSLMLGAGGGAAADRFGRGL